MALTLSPIPVVMVSCIFSYQTPVSEPQDFVNLLHPISDLELHPCKNQTWKCFLFHRWQFWMMFNDLLLLFCIAKCWGPFLALGVQNSSHTTFSLLQSRGEGKQLSFCHTAIKQKAQLVLKVHSLLTQAFLLTDSSVFFTLCILLEFCFLTLCFCPPLPESPGLCECNLTGNCVFFPRGNIQTFFFKSAWCMAAKIFHCHFTF